MGSTLQYSPSKPNGGQRKISLPKMKNRVKEWSK